MLKWIKQLFAGMPNVIEVVITEDIMKKAGVYTSIRNCAVATCLKEKGFKRAKISVGPINATINNTGYRFNVGDSYKVHLAYEGILPQTITMKKV